MKVLTENTNTELNQKIEKNPENYKLVDVLDDLLKSNKEQMQRRKRASVKIGKQVAQKDAELEAEFNAAHPDFDQLDENEQKKLKGEFLKKQQYETQMILDDADLPYEQVGNLLVMGEPGGGKTSIITDWAKQNHIGLVTITGSDIDENVTKGTPFARKVPSLNNPDEEVDVCAMLPSEFFKELDNPNYRYTVLFIDEINRSYAETEGALLTLVQDRTIQDRNYNLGRHKFDKFLFTIAAMNPPAYDPQAGGKGGKKKGGANSEARMLSNALNTRFAVFYWNSDPAETKKFLDKTFDKIIREDQEWVDELENDPDEAAKYDPDDYGELNDIKDKIQLNKRRKEIMDQLVGSGNFHFAEESDIESSSKGDPKNIHVLNARTLTAALMHCDGTIGIPAVNGEYDPNSFMYQFKYRCTQNPEELKKAEYILKPLVNANVQANTANNINGNLLGKLKEWKNIFGGKYGIQGI